MNIDELDRLHAAATAGEWYRDERGYVPGVAVALAFDGSPTLDGRSILRGNTAWPAECRANEDFAMRAKNAWPAISARLRAAKAEVERLRVALRTMVHDLNGMHTEDCGSNGETEDSAEDCDCGATSARNAARATLGEP